MTALCFCFQTQFVTTPMLEKQQATRRQPVY
ncbi:hypothetical protein SAMN05880558_102297 [Aeromonas sp. RU39B]|nr:hypothetical protein SAMN05880558_102297 [Aeromonas sp. RU39B]